MTNDQDRPNGTLKAGDRILITGWCRERTYIRTKAAGGIISVGTTGDPEGHTQINRAFFGDVIQVLSVQWPQILCDVHSVSAGPGDYAKVRTVLDARDFECERADAAYVEAVMAGRPKEPLPDPAPPKPPSRLKASLVLAVLLALAFFGVLQIAELLGVARITMGVSDGR